MFGLFCTFQQKRFPATIVDLVHGFLGPFTLAIFAAISWRFQIARVNYWRFRGDSLHGRFEISAKIAAKIASINGPLG